MRPPPFRRVAILHVLLLAIVTAISTGCSDTQADEQAALNKADAVQKQIEAEKSKLQESIKQNEEQVRLLREENRRLAEQLEATRQQAAAQGVKP